MTAVPLRDCSGHVKSLITSFLHLYLFKIHVKCCFQLEISLERDKITGEFY